MLCVGQEDPDGIIREISEAVSYFQKCLNTLTTLWADSADDSLMVFFLILPGDNLQKMSKPISH